MHKNTPLLAAVLVALVAATWLPGSQTGPGNLFDSSGPAGDSPAVLRGPYLQSASPTSIVVKWRTGEPTQSRVLFESAPSQLAQSRGRTELAIDHEITLDGL